MLKKTMFALVLLCFFIAEIRAQDTRIKTKITKKMVAESHPDSDAYKNPLGEKSKRADRSEIANFIREKIPNISLKDFHNLSEALKYNQSQAVKKKIITLVANNLSFFKELNPIDYVIILLNEDGGDVNSKLDKIASNLNQAKKLPPNGRMLWLSSFNQKNDEDRKKFQEDIIKSFPS